MVGWLPFFALVFYSITYNLLIIVYFIILYKLYGSIYFGGRVQLTVPCVCAPSIIVPTISQS